MSKAKNFQEKLHWLEICFVLLYKVCSKNVRFCESLASYVCKVAYTSSCTVCCALSDFNKNGNESANLPNRCNIKFNENPFFFGLLHANRRTDRHGTASRRVVAAFLDKHFSKEPQRFAKSNDNRHLSVTLHKFNSFVHFHSSQTVKPSTLTF